jgi:hypothetical protein
MPTSAGQTHSSGAVPTHATHASSGGVGRGVGFSWRRFFRLPSVGSRRTATVDEGIRPAVVQRTRHREELAVHLQGRSIVHVVKLALSVGLLLAMFGCVIALTVVAERPLANVPILGTGTQVLRGPSAGIRPAAVTRPAGTWTPPGNHSRDRSSAREATAVTPLSVDPSRDRRTDLIDMAISIRWHRGPESDLPPGSN